MNVLEKKLLQVSLIEGLGPQCVAQVLHNLGPEAFLDLGSFSEGDLVHVGGMNPRQAAALLAGLRDTTLFQEECALLETHRDISWVSFIHPDYPALLKEVHVPPTGIYIRGALPNPAQETIAIVGARKAHQYGQRVIDNLAPELVAHGWAIISGGALGADTMAHEATLKAGGVTVAVLGSGLLQLYPARNVRLFDRIVASGGALVSTFPLRMEPLPGNFPARNRIISGLSKGCIVVQAGEKSGATITAYCALEQGREVFAVPGLVDDPLSVGCHALLKQGATLVCSADDVLKEFGYEYPSAEGQKQMPLPLTVSPRGVPAAETDPILVHCAQPISIDDLLDKTGFTLQEVYSRLNSLQFDGRVEQNFIGMWQKV